MFRPSTSSLRFSPLFFLLAILECIIWSIVICDQPSQSYMFREVQNTNRLCYEQRSCYENLQMEDTFENMEEEKSGFEKLKEIIQLFLNRLQNIPQILFHCPLFGTLFSLNFIYQCFYSRSYETSEDPSENGFFMEHLIHYGKLMVDKLPSSVISNSFMFFLNVDIELFIVKKVYYWCKQIIFQRQNHPVPVSDLAPPSNVTFSNY